MDLFLPERLHPDARPVKSISEAFFLFSLLSLPLSPSVQLRPPERTAIILTEKGRLCWGFGASSAAGISDARLNILFCDSRTHVRVSKPSACSHFCVCDKGGPASAVSWAVWARSILGLAPREGEKGGWHFVFRTAPHRCKSSRQPRQKVVGKDWGLVANLNVL